MDSIDHIQCRGYIEGYYGRLLTWEERRALVDQLGQSGLPSYFYAPKEDTYHRLHWREPYPAQWREEYSAFCKQAQNASVNVIAGVAPGLDFNFKHIGDGDDFRALVAKARQLLNDGASAISLLMDDINVEYNRDDAGFESEGEAHAVLANALADELGRSIFTVPRVYANQLEHESPGYAQSYCRTLKSTHVIFHCGSHIVAPSLQQGDFADYQTHDHRLVVWDNLYANDYCPRRLFVGPWVGRANMREVMLNPTGMPKTDALLIDIMARSASTAGSSAELEAVWSEALREHQVPSSFECVQAHFRHPPFILSDSPSDTSAFSSEQKFEALEELLWKWKSPLSREWYPFLFGLKHDLSLAQGLLSETRIQKTQPEPLSNVLIKKS